MDHTSLVDIANAMVQKGKGILAADESTPTCKKRFDSINVESTEENRNKYRNMLFTADGIENFISGVILFDETIKQRTELKSTTKHHGRQCAFSRSFNQVRYFTWN